MDKPRIHIQTRGLTCCEKEISGGGGDLALSDGRLRRMRELGSAAKEAPGHSRAGAMREEVHKELE